MAQKITDFKTFLQDAKDAVSELSEFERKEVSLKQEESSLERSLEMEKKAVADSVSMTVKKRRDELCASYDTEIAKIQDKIKKIRSKREKAKSQGIKERIQEETSELHSYNRELKVRMKTLFQKEHVPKICCGGYYYALYFTRGFKEILTFFITVAVCFLAVPYGLYSLMPEKKTLFLVLIYFLCILVFGGIYTVIGNMTKGRHIEALREGRTIHNLISSNNRKVKIITNSIRRDKDDTVYNLEKFDDDLAQLEQDLTSTASKKKDALNTFENVTKTIIADEITSNNKARLHSLQADYEAAAGRLRYTETMVKEKKIYITDTYESYLGKEFLREDRIGELKNIIESGEASNISEAIDVYKIRMKK